MFDRWGVAVVSWPKLGGSGWFAWLLLFFHRLFEAEAFAIHLEDVAMVGESIQQGMRSCVRPGRFDPPFSNEGALKDRLLVISRLRRS